jgi:integrase/recombinase XerD
VLILLSGRDGRPEEEFMMAKTKPCWAAVTGPLAEYATGFRDELFRLGYTPLTAACQVRLTAHLSRWMTARGLSARDLDLPAAERYFAARRSAGYANERTVEALGPLLGYLRGLGAAPLLPAEPATETRLLLDRFAAYLASERGLAPTTVALNVRLARPFLQQRALGRDGQLGLDQLTAGEVRAFVLDQACRQPRSAKRIVTALRSLLRFLHVDGILAVPLAGAVPSPAGHALAGLPRALEPGQVEAMLASCDPATATGRRDRAVLLLLSRMGLRAGEVAGLGLEDIDWRRGEITVRGKGGRRDRLPLPSDVGAAIVAYLRDGRPAGALDRTVFIAAQAPREALSYSGITTIVAESAIRAGIPGPVHAHRLRHSAATAMLRGGGSLTEIGQALRHARPATTAIYAKVDVDALRPLGRPWPGQETA